MMVYKRKILKVNARKSKILSFLKDGMSKCKVNLNVEEMEALDKSKY